jgi:hypothetical protein
VKKLSGKTSDFYILDMFWEGSAADWYMENLGEVTEQ